MLGFSKKEGEDKTSDGRPGDGWTRYGVDKAHPPLLTEETIRGIGTRVFEQRYTADRMAAVAGLSFLQMGRTAGQCLCPPR